MSELKERFNQAAIDVKSLPQRPDSLTLLKFYALYKQGSQGDVVGQRPGGMDFVGNAKHDAWSDLKGLSQEEAMGQYVELVLNLQAK